MPTETTTPRHHHGHLCADEDQIRERLERDRTALLAALERIADGSSGGFEGYSKESALDELGTIAQNAIYTARGTDA